MTCVVERLATGNGCAIYGTTIKSVAQDGGLPTSLEIAPDVAERLKDLRQATGWTQETLASEAGRRWQAVSEWERGRREPPISVLERLCARHGWPVTMFLKGHPGPREVLGLPDVAASTRVAERLIQPGAPSEIPTVDEEELKALSSGELLRLSRAMADMLPRDHAGDRLRAVLRHLAAALERERAVASPPSAGRR